MSGGIGLTLPMVDRQRKTAEAQGFIAQNFSRGESAGTTIMVDGTVYFMGLWLPANTAISNIVIGISVQGSGVSTSLVGIGTVSGTTFTRTAISSDLGSAWDSAGSIGNAISYTTPADALYMIAILAKTATTMPTLLRANNSVAGAAQYGSNPRAFGTLAAQTDIPASATIGASSPINYWVAVA